MARLEDLKEKIRSAIADLDVVIGWEEGYGALNATPLFMKSAEDVDRLVFDARCVHNLATYLYGLKGKKVGIVVKGCDSRSVIQLLQEQLIERDNVVIFGMPCEGVVSHDKIRRLMDVGRVESVSFENGKVKVVTDEETREFDFNEVAADKCLSCKYPNPLVFDHLSGKPVEAKKPVEDQFARIDEFEKLSLDERFQFWQDEMSRCIRCYACRNACPLCVCRDHCIAESRDPKWLSQESSVREKWMFQLVHAMHLAGRCTECGECERACPMDIPVLMLKKKLNREMQDLFSFEAGLDVEATPPLFTYQVEEENIEEKEW